MNTSPTLRMQERFNQLWGPRKRLSGSVTYLLPSDRCEQERLFFEHYALKVALGRNFFAPIAQPASILDVGCGLGFWAADLCRTFPEARVVGFDIDAAQLSHRFANYRFVQGTLLRPLPFADHSFEYVHQRLMWATIPAWKWRSVIAELVRVTIPGGYIELVEIAPGMDTMGPATAQLANWVIETEQRSGIDLRLVLQFPTLLEMAGAETFFQRVLWLPVGAAHGHGGKLLEQNVSAFFASFAPLAQERLSLSLTQYQSAWNLMREEWTQRRILCPFVITLARKPVRGAGSYLSSCDVSLPLSGEPLVRESEAMPVF